MPPGTSSKLPQACARDEGANQLEASRRSLVKSSLESDRFVLGFEASLEASAHDADLRSRGRDSIAWHRLEAAAEIVGKKFFHASGEVETVLGPHEAVTFIGI